MDVTERPQRSAGVRRSRTLLHGVVRRELTPEQRLCLAVLEDAIIRLHGPAAQPETAVREVEAWLDGAPGLLTFAYVCEALGWHPDWILSGLRRKRGVRIAVAYRNMGRRGTGV